MSALRHQLDLEDLARDLDMVVFRLEQPIPEDPEERAHERFHLRRELERIREEMEDLARQLT